MEIMSIEIHPEEAKLAKTNIKRAGIPPKINVVVGNAIKVIPTLKDCFDAVFIDDEKTEYYEYLRLMKDKIARGNRYRCRQRRNLRRPDAGLLGICTKFW